jgi:hypothetical protein
MSDVHDDSELHLWAELNLPAELLYAEPARPSPLGRSLDRARQIAALASVTDARPEPEAEGELPFSAGRLGLA